MMARLGIEEAIDTKIKEDSLMIKNTIEQIDDLPINPALYKKIISLLNLSKISITEVSEIVSRDVVMTAKVIRFVNTTSFGVARSVDSAKESCFVDGG